MKVDTSRLKKGTSEVPPECQQLIDKLRSCTRSGLAKELSKVDTWTFGKCELYHWIDILDIFDTILEEATEARNDNELYLTCDIEFNDGEVKLLLLVLNFTTLLIEHSFSRHLYNSVEHLTTLLSSSNMRIVLGVLNLLYMFSKRSNFISRLNSNKKNTLLCRLTYLAETWGGKEYGYPLAYCCFANMVIPPTCVTFYYEYYTPDGTQDFIHLPDIRKYGTDAREITSYICNKINDDVEEEQKMHIYTRISLALSFYKYQVRLQFVQARLQALSVLVYSNALQESTHTLLYPGFLEELVELLEIQRPFLVEIRAAALRTLTSIIHLDRNPHFPKKPGSRLSMIIDVTGAGSYHGFLPILVRTCISNLINPVDKKHAKLFPLPLATALFSFLYHLASYEAGGEALVSCGMMESLLRVINWPGNELEHITFVTRAVRVIDLITNIDMQAFQSHGGLNSFISRLEMEVNLCRREQPFEIQPQMSSTGGQNIRQLDDNEDVIMEDTSSSSSCSASNITLIDPLTSRVQGTMGIPGKTCLPQRAALLKSMLNFLKKAIQDTSFSESIRHVMEGSLPSSLKHIISNAEYYGPSLFLLATDVVTVYVFQEPSLLSSLQDNGLTDVVLQALLKKDVPATREVLGSLPNVFSALCLNARGLASFVKYSPFDKLFRVLLSPVYLSAMRRRRSSDPMGDTASNLGNAMDELMRHQPSLKTEATKAIIKLLEDLVHLGTDPQYICWRAQNKSDVSPTTTTRQNGGGSGNDAGSSDEDEDDEEEASTSSHHNQRDINVHETNADCLPSERTRIPLIDYILNVMKFIDAILSNNSTDDHCREFVAQGGLKPLLSILGLPNLPVDSPITTSAQAVAAICKSILNLAHESQVLQVSLEQLAVVVEQLKPLKTHLDIPGGSVLLRELANAPHIDSAFANANHTPLLHAVSAVHGYIVMLVHVCRTGQSEIRTLSLQKWGQKNEYGKNLLQNLVQLYTALVWESTLLLSLCTDDIIPTGCDFGKEDMNKLVPNDFKGVGELCWDKMSPSCTPTETTETPSTSTGRPAASPRNEAGITVEVKIFPTTIYTHTPSRLPPHLSTNIMDVDSPLLHYQGDTRHFQGVGILEHRRFYATSAQIKYIKSLLGASSRLGRALAELFGLLVKLCVGSPIRQRRGQNFPPAPSYTSEEAKDIARVLSYILVDGLSFNKLPPAPIPKLKLTFLICSVGFTSPMLFDEKRYAYHLMLQKFVEEGGLNAFFQMFRWALSAGHTLPLYHAIEYPNLPDGTGEFLDAWLMLLEKMVNPKAILESPNVITSKNSRLNKPEFDSLQYLITVHKHAYQSVMYLWGNKPLKTYGGRMSESILAILKHILKGDKIIKEKTRALAAERWQAEKILYELGEPIGTTPPAGPSGITTLATTSSPRFLEALATYERNCITDNETIQPQPNPTEAPPPLFPLFVSDQLQQLMDMGFTREHCQEALIHTTTIEQATDYLLNNPASLSAIIDNQSAALAATGIDMDVSEDEQVIRAILMSLGENHIVPPPTATTTATSTTPTTTIAAEFTPLMVAPPPPPPPVSTTTATTTTSTTTANKFEKPSPLSKKVMYRSEEPLSDSVIKEFTDEALEKCLNLLDEVPETVYRVCDLLVTITKRNGEEWRDDMLNNLVARLSDLLDKYLNWMTPYFEDFVLRSEIMINGEMAARAAVILHLFTLLFEGQYQEMRVPCALAMGRYDILKKLVQVLLKYEKLMTHTQGRCGTPKWLAPLFLLIDLYEKVAVYTQRKRDMHGVTTRTWKWYDVASAKWNAYSVSNNKIINDAYWAGETSVRVSCGRQRYTINFNCMSQVNEETGNHRPVILALKATESKNLPLPLDWESPNFGFQIEEDTDPEDGSTSAPSDNTEKTTAAETAARESIEKNMNVQLSGLDNMETAAIVLSCVRFMALPIDRDTLHAVMRVCLRLTRNHENAEIFAKEGGVRLLLEMKQASAFIGFTTLATLLIRHVLEEPYTLGLAMSSVIGSRTLPTIPPGYKELLYMTRQMSSAVSRNPTIFKSVAQQMLRIDINVLRRNPVTEDQRLLLKSIQPTNCRPYSTSEKIAIQVIQELLHSLIVPVTYNITPPVSPTNVASASKPNVTNVNVSTTTGTGITNPSPVIGGGNTINDLPSNQNISIGNVPIVNPQNSSGTTSTSSIGISHDLPGSTSNSTHQSSASAFSRIHIPNPRGTTGKAWSSTPTTKGEYEKPLLPKSAVLKILSDAVRSYNTVAILITEHVFKPSDSSNLITEPVSALSFILDKLLPVNEMNPDRDCSTMARMLIAALASCSEVATAQYAVVAEVKQALARALSLPESAEKHNQIQLLAALIPTMIENCPPDSPAALKLQHYQPRRNGVFYTMVRKGLITDLAKVTQNLDLSCPHTVVTVNAVLKPLETLLRMTNQPVPTNNANKTKKGPTATTTVSSNTTRTSRGSDTQTSIGGFGLASSERSGSTSNITATEGAHTSAASDATNAQDEQIPDDSENTEHDISAAVDSLIEHTNEAQVQVNLEEIMGHFMDRDNQMDIVEDVVERVTDALTGLSGSGSVGTRNNIEQLDSYNVRDPTLDTSSESGDSDSNASENDEREIDEDDDNEEEAEELSEIDVDEETRQFIEMYDHHMYGRHLSPIIPEMARDNDGIARDILMINYRNHRSGTPDVQDGNGGDSTAGVGSGTNNAANATSTGSSAIAVTNHPLLRGVRTVNNSSGVSSQSGVQSVQSSQQTQPNLLVQQSIELPGHTSSGSRAQRTSTSRPRRYQYLNINTRSSNLPVLQRLLGPGSQNIVTANQASGNSSNPVSNNGTNSVNGTSATHVILMNNGFRIYSNGGEDDPIDLLDQAGYLFGRSLAATLSNTPSALHWWIEEAKVLGLESQSDVCLTVCDSLIPELENFKSQELAKTRGKRKKKQNEQTEEETKQKSPSSATPFANIRMGLDINSLQQSLDNMQQTEDQNILNRNEFYTDAEVQGTTYHEGAADGTRRRLTHIIDNAQRSTNTTSQINQGEDCNEAISTDDSSDNESLGSSHTIQPRTTGVGANQSTQTNSTLTTQNNTTTNEYPSSGNPVNLVPRVMLYSHPVVPIMRVRELLDQHLNLIESASNIAAEAMSATSNSDIVSDSEQDETQGMDSDSDSSQPQGRLSMLISETENNVLTNLMNQNESCDCTSQEDEEDEEEEKDDEPDEDDDEDVELTASSNLNNREGNTDIEMRSPPTANDDNTFTIISAQGTTTSSDNANVGIVDNEMVPAPAQASLPVNEDEEDDEDFVVNIRQIVEEQLNKRRMNPDDTDMDSSSSTILESGEQPAVLPENKILDPNIARTSMQSVSAVSSDNRVPDGVNVPAACAQQSSNVWGLNNTPTTAQTDIEGAVGGSLNVAPEITITNTNVPFTPIASSLRNVVETPNIPSTPSITDIHENAETGENDALLCNANNREVPEGIDPSFLEALPDDMREEVIVEHLRNQRIRQRAQQNAIQNEHAAIIEVNPEFLAALPPNIQEEVLAQQRIEQQRVAASATNPNDPVDAAAFFQNLQPSLRQAILTDMEDSQISVLPPDIAAEAQNLRRDWENRNRQIMQERLLSQLNTTTASFSSVLRYRSRVPGPRFSNFTRTRWSQWQANNSGDEISAQTSTGLNVPSTMERQGRPLLDHEAIASLLVLLFIDDPKFNTLRLHRVIRNLCFHVPTREWIIKSLLSIIERSNEQSSAHLHQQVGVPPYSNFRPEWLNIRLDAALGCRANIFLIKKSPVPGVTIISPTPVSIHPQAAPIVCRHTLDLLISLAKSFPIHFLPLKGERKQTNLKREDQPGPSSGVPHSPDFWDILVRLDSASQRRNCFTTKSQPKSGRECPDAEIFLNNTTFDSSPFGQLISMLSYDIVKKSCQLTDKLLRLLSFISIGLPEEKHPNTIPVNEESGNSSLSSLVVAARSSLNATSAPRNTNNTASNNISGNTAAEAATARLRIAASLEEHSYLETEKLLHLSIEVLTSKACSEEGLEDATSLLLNLSQCSPRTRTVILKLLIQGAYALAKTVQTHIASLMKELKNFHSHVHYNIPMTNAVPSTSSTDSTMKYAEQQIPGTSSGNLLPGLLGVRPTKGVLRDRFTKENVVITAPSKVKATCDLQLPSMGPLVSKSSSQAFFLRMLKVIIQIRESVKEALKRDLNSTSSTSGSATPQSASVSGGGTPTASSATRTGAMPKRSTPSSIVAINAELAPLSETLMLDTLWDTLSECLFQLEETPDHHAVLVLQPAVESFFLVHAASQSKDITQNQQISSGSNSSGAGGASTEENTPPPPPPERPVITPVTGQTTGDVAPVSPIMLFNITNTNPSERVTSFANSESDNHLAISGSSSASSSIGGILSNDTVLDDTQIITDITKTSDQNKLASLIQCQSASALADQKKFLQFAEKHRTVLNQILRQTTSHLADGPFAVLVDHTRILDFDVKRRYFRTELERLDEGIRREELAVHVHRKTVFEDSFRELYRRNPEEWKNRFYIVFEDEEGQDAGGLLREWYVIISREIFNPNYALFTVSPGDRVTYMINPSSHANPNHLCYYKFVGRVIAKAIYDNKLLECYFTRSFYKHILGIQVKHTDMESEDYDFYKGLVFLMENRVSSLGYELTFSLEVQEFGVTEIRDLIKNGRNIPVTEDNKLEYIHLVCQLKMNGSIRQQLNAFLEGFYDIIPKRLISIFNEQELELLISGLPNVDIEDLRANTEYHKYLANSIQIQWFWRALRSFDQAERAKFLQFVTGTSKVPLQGFAALEGMNGTQKFQIHLDDRSTDRLPSAHTCFNQLDLPVYKTYDKLRASLLKAIHECSEGFGFA